jgi:hypothetical protein
MVQNQPVALPDSPQNSPLLSLRRFRKFECPLTTVAVSTITEKPSRVCYLKDQAGRSPMANAPPQLLQQA